MAIPEPTSALGASSSAERQMTVDVFDVQARSKAGSDASKQGSYFGQNVDNLEDLPPLPKPSGQCCALRLCIDHNEDAACLLSLPEVSNSSVCVASRTGRSACCLDNCTFDLFLKVQVAFPYSMLAFGRGLFGNLQGMAQSCGMHFVASN